MWSSVEETFEQKPEEVREETSVIKADHLVTTTHNKQKKSSSVKTSSKSFSNAPVQRIVEQEPEPEPEPRPIKKPKKPKKPKKVKPGTKDRGCSAVYTDTTSLPCWVAPPPLTSSSTMTSIVARSHVGIQIVPGSCSIQTNTEGTEQRTVGLMFCADTVERDTMTEAEATTMNKGVGTDPWVEPAPIIITQPAPVILLKAEKPPVKKKFASQATMTKTDVKSQLSMTEVTQTKEKGVAAEPETNDVALDTWRPEHFTKGVSAVTDQQHESVSTSDLIDLVDMGCGTEVRHEVKETMTNIATKRDAFTTPKNDDLKYIEKLKIQFEELQKQHLIIQQYAEEMFEEMQSYKATEVVYNTKHCAKKLAHTENKLASALNKLKYYKGASDSDESLSTVSQCSSCNIDIMAARCSCSTLEGHYDMCTCMLCDECYRGVSTLSLCQEEMICPRTRCSSSSSSSRSRHVSAYVAPVVEKQIERRRVHSVYIEQKVDKKGINVRCMTPSGTHSIYLNPLDYLN